MAALLEALAVGHHARDPATGVAVATLFFGLSAYLPGIEESLVYWAGLSVVLAAGVAGLVTTVLVARAVIRRTRAVALSVSHAWRPRATAAGAVADTAVLAAPAVGCPSGGPCLDTPNRLVAGLAGVDAGAVVPTHAGVVVAGGFVVGATLGNRGVQPANAVAAGAVAAIASLPLAAAAAGDAGTVRTTARYLPVLAGAVSGTGPVGALAAGTLER